MIPCPKPQDSDSVDNQALGRACLGVSKVYLFHGRDLQHHPLALLKILKILKSSAQPGNAQRHQVFRTCGLCSGVNKRLCRYPDRLGKNTSGGGPAHPLIAFEVRKGRLASSHPYRLSKVI